MQALRATELKPTNGRTYSTAEIRHLLKSKLGYNARQVSVKADSIRYVKLTIRDAAVDVRAVTDLARTLDTWTMDQTDYCEGQSVHVNTTKEVDQIHLAPFIEAIKHTITLLETGTVGSGSEVFPTKKVLWKSVHAGYYYLTNESYGRRGQETNNVESLALQVARI